jgi:uncharacterized delta-60 repeat protein
MLLLAQAAAAQSFDPTFAPPQVYAAGAATQALQLSDGSRVVAGSFTRTAGRASVGLEHYLASGQLDPVFAANVASYQLMVQEMAETPNGKLVLRLQGYPIVVGSLPNNPAVVRLEANGSVDLSFAPPTIGVASALTSNFPPVRDLLVQPDGKILLAGQFTQVAGQSASGITRLNVDGSLDTAFQQATTAGGGFALSLGMSAPSGPAVSFVVRQPDGKLLVGGDFATVQGNYQPRLARLLPTGAFDPTFVADTSPLYRLAAAAILPSGSIVVSAEQRVVQTSNQTLVRLGPNGALDRTFVVTAPAYLGPMEEATMSSGALLAQPDGKVLVAVNRTNQGSAMFVARFTTTGALDPTWTVPYYRDYSPPNSMQLLPNGQVLTASNRHRFGSRLARPRAVGVLNTDGSADPAFEPLLLTPGRATAALQADGKLVIGGDFVEVNGVAAINLARLNPNGTVDAAFTANCPAAGQGEVKQVLVLPNGNIMAGGVFTDVGGQPNEGLVRLLPSGQPDATFHSPIDTPMPQGATDIYRIALQADGNLLVNGQMIIPAAGNPDFGQQLIRLSGTTGAVDTSFHAAVQAPLALLPRPDGTIVAAVGTGMTNSFSPVPPAAPIVRMRPNGTLDPTFQTNVTGLINRIYALAAYPDGRLLAGGQFNGFGTAFLSSGIVRLLPNGNPDPTMTTSMGSGATVREMVFQPNGRLLVNGYFPQGSTLPPKTIYRLLANGFFDTSFNPPLTSYLTTSALVQPDGAIVISGFFSTTGPWNPLAVARLLDANVLALPAVRHQLPLAAWPVPAHGQLHLRLEAGPVPQRLRLLDALGRCVRTWPAPSTPEFTLNVAGLPSGHYLLQLEHTEGGNVSRRIVLE